MTDFKNPKEAFVQEFLAKSPLAIALYFEDEKFGKGFVLAAKSKHAGAPWFPINVPEKMAAGHSHKCDRCANAKKTRQVGVVMGIGNRSELTSVMETYKTIIHSEVTQLGFHDKFDEEVLKGLAGMLNEEYRAQNPSVPYRVELLIINSTNGKLKLTRVKADGDMHSLQGFGVIGGYQELKKDVTVRHKAIEALRRFYSKGIPNIKGADAAVNHVMSLDETEYPYNFCAVAIFFPPKSRPAPKTPSPEEPSAPPADSPEEPAPPEDSSPEQSS